jgi:hypothetical protein
MLRLTFDLLPRLCRAAVVAGAAICSLPTPIAAGPVWSGPGDFCRTFSEAIFDDSSYFVAIPSCAGAGTIGLPLGFVAVVPTGLLARGVTYPLDSGRKAADITTIGFGITLAFGAATVGGPFYVLKKLAWDAPQELMYWRPQVGRALVSEDEVARKTSPNGDIDAVLTETNGGATTSFGYLVYLVPRGASAPHDSGRVAMIDGGTRNDQAWGVNLKWLSPDLLSVEYLSARYTDLPQSTVPVGGRDIGILLISGVNDPEAPPGGMLYNLKGRPHDR